MKKHGWKYGKCFVEGDFDRQRRETETAFGWKSQGRPGVYLIACLSESDEDHLDRVQRRVTKRADDAVGNKTYL